MVVNYVTLRLGHVLRFFPARCSASAVFAVERCPSCYNLSVTRRYWV